MNEESLYYIWLNKVRGIGSILASNLIEHFGDIKEIYHADMSELLKVNGIGEKLAKKIFNNKDLDTSKRIIEKCNNSDIDIINKSSLNYPKQLKQHPKAPLILYTRGELRKLESLVAIIGSRRCTEYGKSVTVELVEKLSLTKIPIISGMAKGIDGYAHTLAINNNNYTIAILGTGVDKCYPKEHINLMNKIIETGVVVSQFEPGTNDSKENFLIRNELIAMLAHKMVIIQASNESGALYTATCGLKYNKEVYAVPGTIYDKYSKGTNMLISNGAKIYLSPNNILTEHNSDKIEYKQNSCTSLKGEGLILSSLNKGPMSLDEIKSMMGLAGEKIEELLLEMEIRGDIKQSGGVFIGTTRNF
jgi:DNA processing protein